jgi:hypothetical protein
MIINRRKMLSVLGLAPVMGKVPVSPKPIVITGMAAWLPAYLPPCRTVAGRFEMLMNLHEAGIITRTSVIRYSGVPDLERYV